MIKGSRGNRIRNKFTNGLCKGSKFSCVNDCYLLRKEDKLFNIYCDDVIIGEVEVDCDVIKRIVYFRGILHLFNNNLTEMTSTFLNRKLGDL